jgi:FG-GAP repeat
MSSGALVKIINFRAYVLDCVTPVQPKGGILMLTGTVRCSRKTAHFLGAWLVSLALTGICSGICSAVAQEAIPSRTHLSQLAKLTASDGTSADYLGTSVSVSGNIVVIGVPGDPNGSNSAQGAGLRFR